MVILFEAGIAVQNLGVFSMDFQSMPTSTDSTRYINQKGRRKKKKSSKHPTEQLNKECIKGKKVRSVAHVTLSPFVKFELASPDSYSDTHELLHMPQQRTHQPLAYDQDHHLQRG
mmetsp:Transcript_18675/g.25743  ORF Transcript_18675/g.25743 Transcript_18675/m.25743 type:complete len:115 (-) Transcript_18675:954-1298(-)